MQDIAKSVSTYLGEMPSFGLDADVWCLRQGWPAAEAQLREECLAGTYEVSLLSRVTVNEAAGRLTFCPMIDVYGTARGRKGVKEQGKMEIKRS